MFSMFPSLIRIKSTSVFLYDSLDKKDALVILAIRVVSRIRCTNLLPLRL
jgi:hypothetical protein